MNTLKFGNGEWYGKKDTILAYNDENSNFKPLPFSFDRASSATVINKDGLIETVGSGEPRIDYKYDSKGALLLEPSRSNLVTYSEDFSNGIWTLNNSSVSVNTIISPDGTQNADTFTATNTSGQAQSVFIGTAGLTYTNSIWLKRKTGTGQVNLRGIENISIPITITDEWARYSFTAQSSNGVLRSGILLNVAGDEVYVWGAQLEQGSYATSYIPTQGGVVTRNNDSCIQTVPSGIIGQTEGVIFLDVKMPSAIQSNTTFSIGGGTNGEYAQLEIRSDLSINWRYRQGNTDYINANVGSYIGGDRLKLAFAYKSGSSILYKNGVSIATDNGSIGTNSWNNVYFANFAGTGNLNADVNQLSLYNTRLSNAELQALTTI